MVLLSNPAPAPCSLRGFPTAWFRSDSGAEIGPHSIDEAAATAPTTVILHGDVTAATTVWTGNPDVPSASYCVPTTAAGIAMVPPGQTAGISASIEMPLCSAHAVVGVTPIVPQPTGGHNDDGRPVFHHRAAPSPDRQARRHVQAPAHFGWTRT